jgi:Bardet-Biedl syndrome 1 protein
MPAARAVEDGDGPASRTNGTAGPSAPPVKSVWLDAYSDPVAGVSAYSPCVHVCNLFGDGDNRLVVADEDRKLKVQLQLVTIMARGTLASM